MEIRIGKFMVKAAEKNENMKIGWFMCLKLNMKLKAICSVFFFTFLKYFIYFTMTGMQVMTT